MNKITMYVEKRVKDENGYDLSDRIEYVQYYFNYKDYDESKNGYEIEDDFGDTIEVLGVAKITATLPDFFEYKITDLDGFSRLYKKPMWVANWNGKEYLACFCADYENETITASFKVPHGNSAMQCSFTIKDES
ncbi:MAG: hypothetical protein FWE37_06515 [Spirochaetaceae bacterium]|nr:hypothetical protein [Spirochaetaceae bacterium]